MLCPRVQAMSCSVLRCSDPVAHVETIQTEPRQVDVVFCAAHWAKVQDGARWTVDYQHEAQKMVVLMGEDLPLTLEKAGYRQHVAIDSVEATLVHKRHDDTDDVVHFEIPRDKLLEYLGANFFRGKLGDDERPPRA